MRKTLRYTILLLSFVTLFATSCQKETNNSNPSVTTEPASVAGLNNNGNHFGSISPEMVLRWSDAATYVVVRTLQLVPTPRIPPFRESHYYTMVNLAMHDALNNIVPKYKSYALKARDKDANPDAAVAKAAHDVISFFFGKLNPVANTTPQSIQDSIHNLLTQVLNSIPNGEAKTKGIALGTAAAQAIIQNRTNDGSLIATGAIIQGINPGEYRSTPPFTATGFYDSPGWGNVKTFGIENSIQFPVPPPYPVNSVEYTAEYNEVKRMGCSTCTGVNGRTQDQENIAKFWVESSAFGWYKVSKAIMEQKNMDAWKTARLLALVQMSIADAYIACLKAKMIHFFWRPYTAIQLGNSDGNPNTTGDPTWQVLVSPVPPIADHPSAHACAGGAAAELMKHLFDNDNFNFSFESTSLPANPRNYTSLSQAARENSLSRIYVGYHFRKACMDGEALGVSVGNWIALHALPENRFLRSII